VSALGLRRVFIVTSPPSPVVADQYAAELEETYNGAEARLK
jgi:hypothetical protein